MATGNPLVPQGLLNRVRGSLVIPAFPNLNITAPYVAEEGISLDIDEDGTDQLKTMTGIVNSPAPYVMATATIHVLKTQALGESWAQQFQSNGQIGRVVIHTDTAALSQYRLHNCSILKPQPGAMNGKNASLILTIRGVYNINDYIWSL